MHHLPFQFDHSYAEELLEHRSIITFTCAKLRNGPLRIIHNIQEEMPEYPTRSFKIKMCQRGSCGQHELYEKRINKNYSHNVNGSLRQVQGSQTL